MFELPLRIVQMVEPKEGLAECDAGGKIVGMRRETGPAHDDRLPAPAGSTELFG